MGWTYNNKLFRINQIGSAWGFVYIIANLSSGKFYIGKKFFSSAAYKQVKGKRKKTRKPSDWQNYYGSNTLLQEDVKELGKKNFKRYIVGLCYTKSECSYAETALIFHLNALLSPKFYNYWVSCKITKQHTASFATTGRVNECFIRADDIIKNE